MIKHWLHGNIKLNQEIKKETNCRECIHSEVCSLGTFQMDKKCINYEFGTSEYDMNSCLSCINKFTRFDEKQSIPCFKCRFFKKRRRNKSWQIKN